ARPAAAGSGPAPAAPGAAPASGAGGGAAPRPDELAFLKSLTGSPDPADRTPTTRRSEEISRPAPFPSEPLSGAEPRVGGPGARSGAAAPGATSGAGAPNGAGAAAGATGPSGTGGGTGAVGGGAKTLKCGECGTLNRPTEWYCERCGAELAAVYSPAGRTFRPAGRRFSAAWPRPASRAGSCGAPPRSGGSGAFVRRDRAGAPRPRRPSRPRRRW